jgi:DNA repair protein RecN (Recombination protein N)
MLRGLEIRDILIIDRLSLAFRPGLNVLTGETGAGKSILLDALGFGLGWRSRAEMVRPGAQQGEVTAVFDLSPGHAARAVLDEAGIAVSDELLLRRTTAADGRRAAFVNDRRVSGEVLRALSDRLVELHGQQDDRGLLNPRGHRQLLDAFAGLDLAPLRAAWAALGAARRDRAATEAALAALAAEEDYLRHAVAELDRLDPRPGEEAALDTRRRAMQGAARIRQDILRAHAALSGEGAERLMADAARWLDGAAVPAEGRLDPAIAALSRALIELGEAQEGIETALRGLDFEPHDLEAVEERLFAIRALARKHGLAADDLAGFGEGLRTRLLALEGGVGNLSALSRAVAGAEAAYDAAAAAATVARHAAGRRLDAAIAAELAPLRMERAVFATEIAPGEPGPEGRDAVTFTVAPNPGAAPGPLNRIASGGELSRFLLALKVCLTREAGGLTLIFDEIDRGVGGATADAVGRRLRRLADGAQVLVVTHSPQVAAQGGHHWRVDKRVEGGATRSIVTSLSAAERVDEIARMLAGDTVTDAARAAAKVLLAAGG